MSIATTLNLNPSPPRSFSLQSRSNTTHASPSCISLPHKTTSLYSLSLISSHHCPLFAAFSTNAAGINSEIDDKLNTEGGGGDIGGNNGRSGGGGGGGDNNEGNDDKKKNKAEALMVLAEAGRSLESLPLDLKAAIEDGRIPGSIVLKYFDLEKSGFLSWLMKFGGFKERLLADDLFLAKVGIECGVGMFTKVSKFSGNLLLDLIYRCPILSSIYRFESLSKHPAFNTAAEYERRKETFFDELEVVFADVVMAIIADFMLVYLPAPTVSLRAPLALNAGRLTKFFYSCPDNAFQVALSGTSYSVLQRLGAIVRNGSKLFAVGIASSLVGTMVTNALIKARKAVDHSSADEVESVPVLSTSVAYGVYMSVSSNLRYQVLAGVIEQRILEPMLHQHKLILSAFCFAVRTGNTYLGSLLWVDYARLIGLQKAPEPES